MLGIRNGTLAVSGATLYYEVRGSGPLLLMIHGGGGDADKFQFVADNLANQYTVVSYDRRGHSRSSLFNQTENYRVKTHSDDAHRLLAKLTDEPAYVFKQLWCCHRTRFIHTAPGATTNIDTT